jgi:hypothetical protein
VSIIRINCRPPGQQLDLSCILWLLFFYRPWHGWLFRSNAIGMAVFTGGAAFVLPALGRIFSSFMRILYVGMA